MQNIFIFKIEEVLHGFGDDYVNRKLKNKNEKLQMKLDKLLKHKINTDNKRNRKIIFRNELLI